ncbi:MAG TPA: serpin family protein [Oscillatoriaceae cyanobacterium M33_DOE_052]|uniref:Serpin family protein n=1 Tax=Planktothricoides sp. SpSt-374 TaxID=2282167 RepID=A0A7C3VQQ9_9CYAN|nr:serpin family protein [Oscillatoriaceae cyanobacterium M33_DOE_052]
MAIFTTFLLTFNTSASVASPKSPVATATPNQMTKELAAASNRFGFNLFTRLQQQESQENLFISPTSISTALAMVYNGAKGDTQTAIAKTLSLEEISLADLNQGNAALKADLETGDEKVGIDIANSLWLGKNVAFLPDFIQRVGETYQAKISTLDFANQQEAADVINAWVKEQTQGKIEEIVDDVDPNTIAFLVNAIYFQGQWSEEFNTADTKEMPFTLLDGTQKQHPMMSQSGDYSYYDNEQFQAVALPYGEGRWSLYVFLPKPGVSLDKFYQTLTAENWEKWMQQFSSQPGNIKLPRFKVEYEINLNHSLKAMGMEVAFDREKADFSGMTEEKAAIDKVQHKTFVEVNEEGTEAAAATSVGIVATSMPPPPFEMVVDRPFFAAIRDGETGTILFMGSIVNPE